MLGIEIFINGHIFRDDFIIQDIRAINAERYDNCTGKEKKDWVVSVFKETINQEIDRLIKENKYSDCCGSRIILNDICSQCKEHCNQTTRIKYVSTNTRQRIYNS